MSEHYAHVVRDEGGVIIKKELVKAHLEATGTRAGSFAEEFGAREWGEYCGKMHDIGKYSKGFDRRILEKKGTVDHSTAGAYEAWKARLAEAAFCIAGHHAGIPDRGGSAALNDPTLLGRINGVKENRKFQDPNFQYIAWEKEITVEKPQMRKYSSVYERAFFIRMLFSCLVDADYLETESFMSEARDTQIHYDPLEELKSRLEKYIDEHHFLEKKDPNTVNGRRSEILRRCIDAANGEEGLYSLTVPTGGGKTVSSLAFALNHAVLHGKRRIIYVIPYTSIIEQTSDIFRKILGDENVVEHHSAVILNKEDDEVTDRERRWQWATENWDAPMIVTTTVQFFESLYSNKPSRCRKLHNIVNSVVIFDEAQMIPIHYLKPCVKAIAELVTNYRVTGVLCTATQPALDSFFMENNLRVKEICPNREELYEAFRRVTFDIKGKMELEQLAREVSRHRQVLCVMNTVEEARRLFELVDHDEAICLTRLIYPKHRLELIRKIKRCLEENRPCIVIATSLIEAGVDLDFPVVYRQKVGIDSMLQAAGRCNRNGKYRKEESVVTIFETDERVPSIFRKQVDSTTVIMKDASEIDDPDTIRRYFKFLYKQEGENLDSKKILEDYMDGNPKLPFAKTSDEFRLIEENTNIIYVFDEEGKALEEEWRKKGYSRRLARKMQQYAINVYQDHFESLLACGGLEIMEGGQSAILVRDSLYDKRLGLSMEADEGEGIYV